jgi:stalled ribosome rescue protein Dom34
MTKQTAAEKFGIEKKRWQELYKKTSKPAVNTARNKKAMIIAFLFRCCKTARAARAQFYIQGENRGKWGKREGHWSFLFPHHGPVTIL